MLREKIDGVFLDGFSSFKNETGGAVSLEDTVKWTVESNNIPEIVVLHDAVANGALLGVDSVPYRHGEKAWELAKSILIDGRKPSSYPFEWDLEGDEFINLARADSLNISREDIPSKILINSEVFESY